MGLFDDPDDPSPPIAAVRAYLSLAIRVGAPAYNAGDHRGCFEVYACAARYLIHSVKGADAATNALAAALHRCATEVDVNTQAWVLRRAFDAVLNAADDP